ncbi:MAG: ABC transporter ATP-binding protein [Negativicutes bacterium]|nr:ABC transporter ATP-binding protein [Negativicutes bacterium]
MSILVRDLSCRYGQIPVLQQIGFTALPGELLAVLGPNGAGKSTLFRCMLGLLRYHGSIQINGREAAALSARELAAEIAYIPQSHSQTFNFSVIDMVLMGTTAQVGLLHAPGVQQMRQATAALQKLNILPLAERGFEQISGGEAQLVLIARALAQGAKILIMDEPTASLDYGNALHVLRQIQALTEASYTVLFSTHNPDYALTYAHRVIALQKGKIIAEGPARQVITAELLERLYGVRVSVESFQNDQVRICVPKFN